MVLEEFMDMRLLRALEEGPEALPSDLRRLASYLQLIEDLLAEKAREYHPTWEMTVIAGAEQADLHALQESIAERAIDVHAGDTETVLAKLAIWRALEGLELDCEDGLPAGPLRDRLVHSIEADLQRQRIAAAV